MSSQRYGSILTYQVEGFDLNDLKTTEQIFCYYFIRASLTQRKTCSTLNLFEHLWTHRSEIEDAAFLQDLEIYMVHLWTYRQDIDPLMLGLISLTSERIDDILSMLKFSDLESIPLSQVTSELVIIDDYMVSNSEVKTKSKEAYNWMKRGYEYIQKHEEDFDEAFISGIDCLCQYLLTSNETYYEEYLGQLAISDCRLEPMFGVETSELNTIGNFRYSELSIRIQDTRGIQKALEKISLQLDLEIQNLLNTRNVCIFGTQDCESFRRTPYKEIQYTLGINKSLAVNPTLCAQLFYSSIIRDLVKIEDIPSLTDFLHEFDNFLRSIISVPRAESILIFMLGYEEFVEANLLEGWNEKYSKETILRVYLMDIGLSGLMKEAEDEERQILTELMKTKSIRIHEEMTDEGICLDIEVMGLDRVIEILRNFKEISTENDYTRYGRILEENLKKVRDEVKTAVKIYQRITPIKDERGEIVDVIISWPRDFIDQEEGYMELERMKEN